MVRTAVKMVAILASLGFATMGAAQMPQPAPCDTNAMPSLPPELAGWATHTPIRASSDEKDLAAATLQMGKAVDATLLPTPQVSFPLHPEKPGGSVSFGGLFSFSVDKAGTYRIAQGSGAWIDVVRHGKAVTSIAHGHGPACSGVMKMVDFPLTPGRYILQVSANAGETLSLMVAPLR